MRPIVTRIVLLAYLIGGLAIPAMHQHGPVGHGSVGHDHGSHSAQACTAASLAQVTDDCGTCVPDQTSDLRRVNQPIITQASVVDSACGELCTVCSFSKSGQHIANPVVASHFIFGDSSRLAFVDPPIRDRSSLDPSAPRGPPVV